MSDPRLLLTRDGVAAADLEGVLPAARFVSTRTTSVVTPSASLHAGPDSGAEQTNQLLFGEAFDVLDIEGGWAFGRARRDGYVGWARADALGPFAALPTHRVSVLRTFAFGEPHIRAPAWGPLPLNALVCVDTVEARFARVAGAGWVAADHLAPIGVYETDPAAVAVRYLGAPYRWGARDGDGVDCSGLVQQAFYACGRALPRDADQQERVGVAVDPADLRRNDLVFWDGHVGLMLDSERLIHANAWHMAVEVEPLQARVDRGGAIGGGRPSGFRRV